MNANKLNMAPLLVFPFILTLLSLWVWGYSPASGDAPIHLSYVHHRLNPSLFQNDDFVATLYRYPSFFWQGIALISTDKLLPPLLFLLHLFSTWLFFVGVLLLGLQIYGNLAIGLLGSLLLILFNFIPWGGAHILASQLDHGVLVRSLLLFSLYLVLQNKFLLAGVLLGISFNLHPMITVFMAFALFCLSFTFAAEKIKRLAILFITALLFSLPMLLRIFHNLSSAELSPEQHSLWFELVRLRLWHHLYPLLWSKKVFLIYAVAFLLWVFSLWYAPPDRKILQPLLYFSLGIFILCLLGFIASTILLQPIILKLHLFRSLKFWAILVAMGFASSLYKLVSGLRTPAGPRLLLRGITLCLIALGLVLTLMRYYISAPLNSDWKKICLWVKQNLPENARILTPPDLSGFRLLAHRSPFVEWKDGAALLWDDRWAVTSWWQKIQTISPRLIQTSPRLAVKQLGQDYEALSPQQIKQTNAEYFIARRHNYPEFKLLTSSGIFSVYQLQ